MRSLFFKKIFCITFCLSVVFLTSPTFSYAVAGVPTVISYQGRLTNSSGTLLGGAGTLYQFKFSIWDSPTVGAGTKLWPAGAPGTSTIQVVDGVFNVDIGDTGAGYPDVLNYNFQDTNSAYLQIEVSGDATTFETLGPRQRITSSATAINAQTLQGLTPGTSANSLLKLGSNGEITLSGSGTSSLGNVTFGTVSGGTWQGNAIADQYITKTGNWTGSFDGHNSAYYMDATHLVNFQSPFDTAFAIKTTDALNEGTTHQYFSNARALAALTGQNVSLFTNDAGYLTDLHAFSTDNLMQGTVNKYYSSTLFNADLATKTTDSLAEGTTHKYYSSTLFNNDLATKTTDNLAEGSTYKYFTDIRAQDALAGLYEVPLTFGAPFNRMGNNITIAQSNGSGDDGYLSSTDWNTFNTKQAVLISGTNIKTINSNTLLGAGDISIAALIGYTPYNATNPNGYIANLSTFTTDDLSEGLTRLYFNNIRAVNALMGQNISIFANDAGYITGNQGITLSGDISGSGTTSITTIIGAGKVINTMLAGSITASKLIGTDIATVGTITAGTWQGASVADAYIASAATWNAKQNAITTGTTLQYLRGDLSLATFPTALSSFTNDANYITSAGAPVQSVFGRTGAVVAVSGDYNTAQVTEDPSYLYFTTGRAQAALLGLYEVPLTFSTGLTRSTNTITNNLSTGIPGGQLVVGGTASGDTLTLSSTSNATKGNILFGNSAYDEANNRLAIGTTLFDGTNPEKLLVQAGTTTSVNVIAAKGTINSYLQMNLQNQSSGTSASSDIVATADNGNETTNYIDMGINSSGYTGGIFGGTNDAYLYNLGQNMLIGTGTASKSLIFMTGGTSQASNERMRIDGTGKVGIGVTAPNTALDVNGWAGARTGLYVGASSWSGGVPSNGLKLTANGSGAIYSIESGGGFTHKFNTSNVTRLTIADSLMTSTVGTSITDTTLAASGSLAGSVLNLAQTWNTTGNPTALLLNVTKTASGSTAKLLDLQVGGTSRFSVLGGNTAGDSGITINSAINGYNSLIWSSNNVGFGLIAGGSLGAVVSSSQGFTVSVGSNSPAYQSAALGLVGQSLSGSATDGLINATQTWNTTGNPIAIKLNVTNTASGVNAKLIDLQVGGVSKFNINSSGSLGLGVAFPQSFFNASQLQYNTGTASQSGQTVTGVGTTWTSAMIGSQFFFADGTSAGYIQNVGSTTSLTVSVSQTVASQNYAINYQGLRGNSNNWAIGSDPSGNNGPFFKVGGVSVRNQWTITGGNLYTTITAGFDASTNTDGDGSLASFSNTSNSAASGAVRFIRSNPSGAVGANWQLGEIATYGGITASTYTAKNAGIQFFASQTQTASAAGSYMTFSTTANSTTTLSERMRIAQDGMISMGTSQTFSTSAAGYNGGNNAGLLNIIPTFTDTNASSNSAYTMLNVSPTINPTATVGIPGGIPMIRIKPSITTSNPTQYTTASAGILVLDVSPTYSGQGIVNATVQQLAPVFDNIQNNIGSPTIFNIAPSITGTNAPNGMTGTMRGVYYNPTYNDSLMPSASSYAWQNTKGMVLVGTTSGNLGVGTTTPTSLLQVNQPTTGMGVVSNTAGGTTVTGFGTQFTNTFKVGDSITIGGQTIAISAIASDTSMTTAAITNANTSAAYTLTGGTRFSVKGGGPVIVGGSTYVNGMYGSVPSLYVNGYTLFGSTVELPGTVRVTSSSTAFRIGQETQGSQGNALFNAGADTSGVYFGNYLSNPVRLMVNNTDMLKVFSTGNVSIGTTADNGSRLNVTDTTLAGSGSLAGGLMDLRQTWNTTGAPTAIKLNVTDTASNSSSKLMDLQVGGNSMLNVNKFGQVSANSDFFTGSSFTYTSASAGGIVFRLNNAGIGLGYDTANSLFLGSTNTNGVTVYKTNGGRVGVGVAVPTNKLSVVGIAGDTTVMNISTTSGNTCSFDTTTGAWSCASDIRLKHDISDIISTEALSKISALNPVMFKYNWQNQDEAPIAGFIAQDFEKVFPELVHTDATTGYKSLSYAPLMPYAIKALQELDLKVSLFTPENIDASGYAKIKLFLADVANNIIHITDIFTTTVHVDNGIEMKDKATGQVYCVVINNGEWLKIAGSCADAVLPATTTPAGPVEPVVSPVVTPADPATSPVVTPPDATNSPAPTTTTTSPIDTTTAPAPDTSSTPIAPTSVPSTPTVSESASQ